ncbi:actin-like ATPase domain-containing protein [Ceratobasidium sp. AG-I]|nr:actin-like ATPase domain-containing protein [Ceratobasidium sp. AG-I]
MVRSSSAPKREEVPMKFTAFHVPPVTNTKNVSSSYLRAEGQTIWARNAAAQAQRKRTAEEAFTGKEKALANDSTPGAKTVVIHPGSRWLKIGMATDVFPVSIPNVIARKQRVQPVAKPAFHSSIIQPQSERETGREKTNGPDEAADLEEPFVERTAGIRSSLLARMKFYKLQVLPNASSDATRFNTNYKPTTIADHNDPYRVEWLGTPAKPVTTEEYFIGEKALTFADPAASSFTVKWPMRGTSFNTRDYDSAQAIISDIETIWSEALLQELEISRSQYKDLSVILVIPDYFDRFYVRELVNVLLVQMGFAQLCVQQESLCAAFGAGLSTACVVDLGAVKTSIACVDEGQVVPDTRITLDFGGDDITEYLFYLLKGINWPYRECELNRIYDWNLMTKLKKTICSLAETDVALNVYDFEVRRPGHITERYALQVYDEPVLAAMCIFEPRIIDFDAKRATQRLLWTPENVEDIPDFSSDVLTQAMLISTQHLLPAQQPPAQVYAPNPTPTPAQAPVVVVPQLDGAHDADGDTEMDVRSHADAGVAESSAPSRKRERERESSPGEEPEAVEESEEKKPVTEEKRVGTAKTSGDDASPASVPAPSEKPKPKESHLHPNVTDAASGPRSSVEGQRSVSPTQPPPLSASAGDVTPPDPDIEIVRISVPEGSKKKARNVEGSGSGARTPVGIPIGAAAPTPVIDVRWEASKLPLDVAIFNSARAAGGVDRIKKFLQVVVIVGGTSIIPGMVHALESRLQAIAFPLVPGMEKVQVVPAPKDIDPRVLTWKGAAVLAKLEAVNDMWITPRDWEVLGMRGLRERTLFM